jgi:hypothetical protein
MSDCDDSLFHVRWDEGDHVDRVVAKLADAHDQNIRFDRTASMTGFIPETIITSIISTKPVQSQSMLFKKL